MLDQETRANNPQRWALLALLALAVAIAVGRLVYRALTFQQAWVDSEGFLFHVNPAYSILWLHRRIALALVLALVACLPRNRKLLFLSAGSVVWVVIEYLIWLINAVRQGAIQFGSEPSVVFIWGVSWWDVLLAIISVAILALQIRTLADRRNASQAILAS